MEQLVDEFDPSSTASIFSTKNQVSYLITSLPFISYFSLFKFFLFVLIVFLLFQQQLTDDYFFESAEKISFFFEGIHKKSIFLVFSVIIIWVSVKFNLSLLCFFLLLEKAFGDDGNLKQPKELSLNKVGHGKPLPLILCVFELGSDWTNKLN